MLQRQGSSARRRDAAPRPHTDGQTPAPEPKERTSRRVPPGGSVELRKVAWPTREEVIRYSIIVLITCAPHGVSCSQAYVFAKDRLRAVLHLGKT